MTLFIHAFIIVLGGKGTRPHKGVETNTLTTGEWGGRKKYLGNNKIIQA